MNSSKVLAAPTVRIGPAPYLALDVAGEGELLLFLHGIGGNRTVWADQLPAFAPFFTASVPLGLTWP